MVSAFKEFFNLFHNEFEAILEMAMAKAESRVNIFDEYDQEYYKQIVDWFVERGYGEKLKNDDAFLLNVVKQAFAARYGGEKSQTPSKDNVNSIIVRDNFRKDPASYVQANISMRFKDNGKTTAFEVTNINFDGKQLQDKFAEKGWDVTKPGMGYGGQIQNEDGKKMFRPIAEYLKAYMEGSTPKTPKIEYNLRQKTAGTDVSHEDAQTEFEKQKDVRKFADIGKDKEEASLSGDRAVMKMSFDEQDQEFLDDVDKNLEKMHLTPKEKDTVRAKALGMRYGNGFFDSEGNAKNMHGSVGNLKVDIGRSFVELRNLRVNPEHLLAKFKKFKPSRDFFKSPIYSPEMSGKEKQLSYQIAKRFLNQKFYQPNHARLGGHSHRKDDFGGLEGIIAKDFSAWNKRSPEQQEVDVTPIENEDLASMADWRNEDGDQIVRSPNINDETPNREDNTFKNWHDLIKDDAKIAMKRLLAMNIQNPLFEKIDKEALREDAIIRLLMANTGDEDIVRQSHRIKKLRNAMQDSLNTQFSSMSNYGTSLDAEVGSNRGMSGKNFVQDDNKISGERERYTGPAPEEVQISNERAPEEVQISKERKIGKSNISDEDLAKEVERNKGVSGVSELIPPPSFRLIFQNQVAKRCNLIWSKLSTERKKEEIEKAKENGWLGTWEDDGRSPRPEKIVEPEKVPEMPKHVEAPRVEVPKHVQEPKNKKPKPEAKPGHKQGGLFDFI